MKGQIGATYYLKGIYDDKPAGGGEENKANSKPIAGVLGS